MATVIENEKQNLEYAECLCDAGCRYCDWESWDIGIKLLTKALEIKPDYPEALFRRAHAYQYGNCNDGYNKAIADYVALLEMDSDYNKFKVRYYLAYAYYQRGDRGKASTEWKSLLEDAETMSDISEKINFTTASFFSLKLHFAGLFRKPGEELSQCEINLLVEDLSYKRMGREGEKMLDQYEIDLLVEYLLSKQSLKSGFMA